MTVYPLGPGCKSGQTRPDTQSKQPKVSPVPLPREPKPLILSEYLDTATPFLAPKTPSPTGDPTPRQREVPCPSSLVLPYDPFHPGNIIQIHTPLRVVPTSAKNTRHLVDSSPSDHLVNDLGPGEVREDEGGRNRGPTKAYVGVEEFSR